jgi:hypothetical protein
MASARSLRIALGLSLVLHAVLLLAPPLPSSPTAEPSPLPDLRVWIRDAADRLLEAEHDDATRPPASRAIAAAPAPAAESARTGPAPASLRDAGTRASAASTTGATRQPAAVKPLTVPGLAGALPTATSALEKGAADDAPARAAVPEQADRATHGTILRTDERRRLVARVEALASQLAVAPGSRVVQWRDDGRQYSAVVEHVPQTGLSSHEEAVVNVTIEQDGRALQTRLRLKRLAFSHYTQLVDRWDEQVQLHDDEIAGRFHSNSPIVVGWDGDAAPRFLGRVTTASSAGFRVVDVSRRRARRNLFQGGLQTGVPRIDLRRQAFAAALGPRGASGTPEVRTFASSATIVFLADGGFEWRPEGAAGERRREPPVGRSLHLLAAEGAELRVRGVVGGSILVYSPERIVITGDLRYARATEDGHPRGFLGLVSNADVVVAEPRVTGAGDLTIEAAIYARRRFIVRDSAHREPATLHLHGSLAAGSIAETEPRYATRLRFDPRLESERPPGFPVTDRFEALPWEESWVEAER